MIQNYLSFFCVVGFQDNSIYLNFCGEIKTLWQKNGFNYHKT